LSLTVDRLALPEGTAGGTVRLDSLLAHAEALRTHATLDLRLSQARLAGISAAEARLDTAGALGLVDGKLQFTPAQPIGLSASSLDLGAARIPGTVRLALATEEEQPVLYDTVGGALESALIADRFTLAATAEGAGRITAN